MNQSRCLVITSIQSSENKVLKDYATLCKEHQVHFIIAGDTKSPENFDLKGCEYLGIGTQQQLPFQLAKLLPHKNYAKKNIAYLQAIQKGHDVIIETDDDNLPLKEFWESRSSTLTGDLADTKNWVNVYHYFSENFIWPRGFSLNHLKEKTAELKLSNSTFFSPIQQTLVDENPDVDAIYRLSMLLPFYFKKRKTVVLGKESVCPFNSQNTTWFKEAFPLLYLPSYCSFRMCDIWRSFIAQRILWTNGWHLSFHSPNAYQQRNAHDLMLDFEEEISGYLNNAKIVEELKALPLLSGEANIFQNLRACYKLLTDKNYVDKKELVLLEAWIQDITNTLTSKKTHRDIGGVD